MSKRILKQFSYRRMVRFFSACFLILLMLYTNTAYAQLSQDDLNAIAQNSVFYKAGFPCTSGGAGQLAGSDNATKIWNFLASKGLTAQQVAGVMGNLQAESGFEPRLVEYGKINSRGEISVQGKPSSLDDTMVIDGKTGYGLAQWTSLGRQQGLHDAAVKAGTTDGDLGVQLDYLYSEAQGRPVVNPFHKTPAEALGAPNEWEGLKRMQDVASATIFWHAEFEISNDDASRVQNRVNLANALFAQYGGDTGTAPSGQVIGSGCGSAGVVGGYSLPVDRRFYDEHQDWFTKPHHDYPAADIPVPSNTPIYSMSAGTIVLAPTNGDCGTGVEIDAGNGVRFLYCHGSDGGSVEGARNGDRVQPGQLIMHSDNTGSSTGPHVHVGIRVNGTNFCPQQLFTGIASGSIPDIQSLPTSGCTY